MPVDTPCIGCGRSIDSVRGASPRSSRWRSPQVTALCLRARLRKFVQPLSKAAFRSILVGVDLLAKFQQIQMSERRDPLLRDLVMFPDIRIEA